MTDIQFTEKTLTLDGRPFRYLIAGEGPPLVCLQDIGGLNPSQALMLLARSHKVIIVEFPLLGASHKRRHDREEIVRALLCLLQKLGLTNFNLWAKSFAAQIAFCLASQHKDLVRTLLVCGPVALDSSSLGQIQKEAERQSAKEKQSQYLDVLTVKVPSEQRAFVLNLFGSPVESALAAHLEALDCPTLILCGTRDQISPPIYGRVYKEIMPKSNLVMIYDAGHDMDNERPEAVVEVVSDYIERHDSFLVTRQDGIINP